jgi:lauroyl/myristoyl acyltransferase
MSVLVPARKWQAASRRISVLLKRISGSTLRAMATYRDLADIHPAYRNVSDVDVRLTQTYMESRLQICDQNLLRRWRPEIEIAGTRHVEAALARGHGVIFWVTPSAYSDLIAKMAFRKAGFAVSHLSRPGHGFSRSRFGVRFLNRLRTRIEDRYLKDRIRIHKGEEKPAMLALRRALQGNGIVSITVGAQSKSVVKTPMRAGYLRLATGALRLANLTGAALLPVFTFNTDEQQYRVDIGSDISRIAPDQPTNHQLVMNHYVQLLEHYLDEYPAQWRGAHDFVAS